MSTIKMEIKSHQLKRDRSFGARFRMIFVSFGARPILNHLDTLVEHHWLILKQLEKLNTRD